jgi:hypothetical protein
MLIVNKNKTFSMIIACSFLTMNVLPAFADEYMVLPPLMDENPSTQDRPLPSPQVPAESATPTMPPSSPAANYSDEGDSSVPQQSYQEPRQTYQEPQQSYQENYQQTSYRSSAPLQGTISTVPVGTAFQVVLNDSISSQRFKVGDIFTATLNQPIAIEGNVIVEAGSEVVGQVTFTEDAGRAGKNAQMEIKFTRIKPFSGNIIPITGKVLTQDNSGILKGGTLKNQLVQSLKAEAIAAGSGTIVGLGIGAMAGHAGTGAVVGTVSGAGIGAAWLLYRKGKEVQIPEGTKMVIVLEQPFNVIK